MKYLCVNKHMFIHPAKRVVGKSQQPQPSSDQDFYINTEAVESYVCPFCQSLEYSEFVEPKPEITSVISVDLADVDVKLKEGYVVESLYAKTATLVRREVSKNEC